MKFYLFRHGMTDAVKKNVLYGDQIITAPILEDGIPVVQKVAEYLKSEKPELYVSSPFLRCKQTAEIIEQITKVTFAYDTRLSEFDPSSKILPQEGFPQFKERVNSFLGEMKVRKRERIAICTHGAVIAALKHLLMYGVVDVDKLNDYPQPGVVLSIDDGKLEEVNLDVAY
jgi:broad specificity phosphatase PhoE